MTGFRVGVGGDGPRLIVGYLISLNGSRLTGDSATGDRADSGSASFPTSSPPSSSKLVSEPGLKYVSGHALRVLREYESRRETCVCTLTSGLGG